MSDPTPMTPQHTEWPMFLHRLTDLLDAAAAWDGTLRHTCALLATMQMDVEASLACYRVHGCGCDCEVVLNVDRQAGTDPLSVRWN